jgi:hypothetical protein
MKMSGGGNKNARNQKKILKKKYRKDQKPGGWSKWIKSKDQ